MYFDSYESNYHEQAKMKLFELLISKRIKIKDHEGNTYEIFTNKYPNEFLHIESFVMNYNNDALFSNPNPPCVNKIEKPLCNQKGYYGAFKELPCKQCLMNNLDIELNRYSEYASYRPDIAFGYEGKHKIWFEVKHSHESTYKKIRFCHERGIILLEIDAEKIVEFNDFNGELVFNRLKWKDSDVDVQDIKDLIQKEITNNGYVKAATIKAMLYQRCIDGHEYFISYEKLINELQLVELCKYNDGIKNHFNLSHKVKILVPECELDKLNDIEEKYIQDIDKNIVKMAKEVVKELKKKKYMPTTKFKNKLSDKIPKGFRNRIDFDKIFVENDLVNVSFEDYAEIFIELGFGYHGKKKLLLPFDVYEKVINKSKR